MTVKTKAALPGRSRLRVITLCSLLAIGGWAVFGNGMAGAALPLPLPMPSESFSSIPDAAVLRAIPVNAGTVCVDCSNSSAADVTKFGTFRWVGSYYSANLVRVTWAMSYNPSVAGVMAHLWGMKLKGYTSTAKTSQTNVGTNQAALYTSRTQIETKGSDNPGDMEAQIVRY